MQKEQIVKTMIIINLFFDKAWWNNHNQNHKIMGIPVYLYIMRIDSPCFVDGLILCWYILKQVCPKWIFNGKEKGWIAQYQS